MTPKGLAPIVPLFHPLVMLVRELWRTDPLRRELFFAGDNEISLRCTLPDRVQTLSSNITLFNSDKYTKPPIKITGSDCMEVDCRFIRLRLYEENKRRSIAEIIFTPGTGYDLNLRPEQTSRGLKLPQIRSVIIGYGSYVFTVNNRDHRSNIEPLQKATL